MRKINYFLGTVILIEVFIGSAVVWGKTTEYFPYVSVTQQYSDNILFSSTNPEKDYITIAEAGLLSRYHVERIKMTFDGSLEQLFYQKNSDFNGTEGEAFTSLDYKLTERLGLSGSARYRRDLRKDRTFDKTGLVDNSTGDRKTIDFNVASNYAFSELTRGELSLGYENIRLEDSDEDERNDIFKLNLSLTRDLSQYFRNTNGLFNFSYRRYASDREYEVNPLATRFQDFQADIFQLYVGFSKQLTELFSFYSQFGVSYTLSDEKNKTRIVYSEYLQEADDAKWGGVILSGLNYKGLYTDVGVSVSHDISEGTGTAGTVERSKVGLDMRRRISQDFSLSLNTNVYWNNSERKLNDDIRRLSFGCKPGFNYRFADTWIFSGYYRFTSTEDKENDQTTKNNLLYLRLYKKFDWY